MVYQLLFILDTIARQLFSCLFHGFQKCFVGMQSCYGGSCYMLCSINVALKMVANDYTALAKFMPGVKYLILILWQ